VAGTFEGTLTSGQVIDLGRVGVKSGSYSVEISSNKSTLQPFRANVKPAQPKTSQPIEEEVVVIDLDSVGQKINEGNENNLGDLDSNTVTLGKVGAIPGQSMESPDFIDKIENEQNSDNLTETEFQPLGEASQTGMLNQEAPFNENDSVLQTAVESLASPEQQGIQPQSLANPSADNSETANNQNIVQSEQSGTQGIVLPSVPGQTLNDTTALNNNVNTVSTEESLGNNLSEGQFTSENQAYGSLPITESVEGGRPNQTVSEKTEESPRIIQGFQSLAQNVSRGIQNLAQNLGLAPDSQDQNQIDQSEQMNQPESKDDLKGPVYEKLLTAVSTGVFYNDDGTTFYAQPGTKAYESAVENLKTRVNNSKEPIYDDNGNTVGPTIISNEIAQIANRVLSQTGAKIADQTAAQNTAINALQNIAQSTAQGVAENVATDTAQRAVQSALQNSNVDSVQDVVENILQGTAQNTTSNAVQEVVQNAAEIADRITEQIAEQNVIQQVSQDVSRAVTQNALQAAEQIAEGSMQEASQIASTEIIQGVIKDSVAAAVQTAGESIQETTQDLFDNVQDAAKVVVQNSIQSAESSEASVANAENLTETDDLKQLTYQELAQAAGITQATDAIQALGETLEQTETTLDAIEQSQSGRISIQRAGQIPGDSPSDSQPAPGYYNEDGVFAEQPVPQFTNQQGPVGVEQVQLPDSQGTSPDVQRNYLEPSVSPITGQPVESNMGQTGPMSGYSPGFDDAATQAATQAAQAVAQSEIAQVAQAVSEITNQTATGVTSPEMVSLPEAQITQDAQGRPLSQLSGIAENNITGNTNDVISSPESSAQQSKIYSVTEQINVTSQGEKIDSNGNVLPVSKNDNLNQTTYSTLPENQMPGYPAQDQAPQRRRDRINLTSSPAGDTNYSGSQEASTQIQATQLGQSNVGSLPGQSTPNSVVYDASVQPAAQVSGQELNTLQQVTLPQSDQTGNIDSGSDSIPRLFAVNRRTERNATNEDSFQQPGRINLNNTLQPRDIEKISEQIISEGLIPQAPEASNLTQFDYQGLDQQQPRALNPVITGVNASGSSEPEEDDEEDAKLKSVKYITVGGDTLMKTEVPKDQPTDASTTQQIKEALSAESIIYQELLKERERFRTNLETERGNNRANLRRAEQQIQQELVKVITEQPIEAEGENSSPINQIIQSIIKEDREIAFERETESIENTIQNVQERQQEANKVAQKETLEAIKTSQEKGPEKVFIDATKIIQMIQEKQKENESAKEIDEFLLRQRIERELKYEFNQMQIDHEKKLRMVYRRMIEQMYLDMLNS
jgi:hypothetical protein